MKMDKSVVGLAGAGALIGAVVVAMPITSSAQVGPTQQSAGATHLAQTHQVPSSRYTGAHVMVGPSGNRIEMVAPHQSRYVPKILKAPKRSRTKARTLLSGVNRFCQTGRWRTSRPDGVLATTTRRTRRTTSTRAVAPAASTPPVPGRRWCTTAGSAE